MAKNTTTSKTSNEKNKREDVSGMRYDNKAAYKNSTKSNTRNAENDQSEDAEDCHNAYERDEY